MFKYRIPEIFLGALMAVAIFAMGMVFVSSRQPIKSDQQAEHQSGDNKILSLWIPTDSVGLYTLVLAAFTGVLAIVSIFQGVMLVRADRTTRIAATAAKLNAQALIDAESAQMYLVLGDNNLEGMSQLGRFYDNSPTMNDSPAEPPWIRYRLRNYGKSPAILQSVLHGLSIEKPHTNPTRTYNTGRDSVEIVGVGEQSLEINCTFGCPFTFGDVRSIVTNDRLLVFYGEAVFIDHFGRRQTLEWEFVADEGKWNLISHRNTRGVPERQNL